MYVRIPTFLHAAPTVEAYRARGISRSGFKLQGPTTRRSTSPGTLGPARGGTDPSVHGQPTVPTSLREDASLYRRDTRVAKGPTAFHLRLRKDQVRSADRKTRHPRCEGTDGVSPTFSDFRLTAITEAIITHPDEPFGPRQKPPDHRIERPHTWARAYAQAYVPT